ncbi:acyl carrier protein [Sphingobium sp. PNB]|uniref:acyl carrier protein n=1 Tax=Sphingobium sp. PNB TaxID=863934 RepID=UPI001CA3A6D4|nr:acyl carrier protein [Sphingobium sp. PNB]MCB4858437.1 acyl carrier protein [Sphingobium sp. PNB]
MNDDFANRVRSVVALHLDVEPEKVLDHSSFIDDLDADSLDVVELVMAFEEEFRIEIPDQVAERILTVEDAINHIRSVKTGGDRVVQVGR